MRTIDDDFKCVDCGKHHGYLLPCDDDQGQAAHWPGHELMPVAAGLELKVERGALGREPGS